MLLGDYSKNHSIDDNVLLEYSILLMVMSLLYLWSTLLEKYYDSTITSLDTL